MLGRFFVVETPDAPAELEPVLTRAFERAKSGLRRDVAALVEALDGEELLVPLSKSPPDVPDGRDVELGTDLTLAPHLMPDAEGEPFVALFTHTAPLAPIVEGLGWQTDGEDLKVCRLPARLAFELARTLLDDTRIRGLVVDPGAPSELGLTRNEVQSLLAGRPIPLVAYVEHIPLDERDKTLVAEQGDPLPEGLVTKLDAWVGVTENVTGYRLERTFNPDRDLEPHLSLTLHVTAESDRKELFQAVTSAISSELPPPGYLDVLFES